jgi:hypothetical protein
VDRSTRLPSSAACLLNNCHGCQDHVTAKELYLPAPPRSGLEETFTHHITTRNFFAWLYNIPQAGRTLGESLVELLERINTYRPDQQQLNREEVIAYVESQKYLDFRECIDHALAALYFAESLQEENLWQDAFAHCVGLSHRSMAESLEYEVCSPPSSSLEVLKASSNSATHQEILSQQLVETWTNAY